MRYLRPLQLISLILVLVCSCSAQRIYNGKVVDVIDAKTVVVETETGKITAEMQYIEVPETASPLNKMVVDHLKDLVLSKKVQFQMQGFSTVKLTGGIFLGDIDVAQQMLRDGAAWVSPSNQNSQNKAERDVYENIQQLAKNEKRGVWAKESLKPDALVRAEGLGQAARQEQISKENPFGNTVPVEASYTGPVSRKASTPNKNPKFGNVGALLNGYDPETKAGYLSTTLLGLEMSPEDVADDVRMAIDVTFYYREYDQKPRKSMYVFTIVSTARKPQFATASDLMLYGLDKNINVGKPKRTVSRNGDYFYETLKYQVSRSTMEKIANNATYLKVGLHVIQPTGMRYILLNMIQVAG